MLSGQPWSLWLGLVCRHFGPRSELKATLGPTFGTSGARACDQTFYNGKERDQTPRRTGPRAPL